MKKTNKNVIPSPELLREMEALEILGGAGSGDGITNVVCVNTRNCGTTMKP